MDDLHQRLDQLVHVLATLHRVLDEVQRVGDARRVTRVDLVAVLLAKIAVQLHEFVEARLTPGFGIALNARFGPPDLHVLVLAAVAVVVE